MDILQTTSIALFMVKRSLCAQVTLSLKLQQRCNRRTHNETMSYSFLASIHSVIDVIIDDLPFKNIQITTTYNLDCWQSVFHSKFQQGL